MRLTGMGILLSSAVVLFIAACVSEQGVDKSKFAELDRTLQDLKAAITKPDPCGLPDTLEQRLAREITAVRDKADSKGERDLIAAYSQLLTTCRDGLLLCRSRTQFSHFDFFPKGRIYVSQELDPLVEKYGLSVDKHLYQRTGQYMRSVDGSSIGLIWGSALTQIQIIENMMKYN